MSRSRLIIIAILAAGLIVVMATTGPHAEVEATGSIVREGGVCLQLEQWGLFGWVIVGQTYTSADIAEADWHMPPVSDADCEHVAPADQEINLPSGAEPDVYRVCGLDDNEPCLDFNLVDGP
jgi:hypothetical protein